MASPSRILVLFIVLIGSLSVNGFLFGRRSEVARSSGRAIDEECLAKADAGSCEFYTCFENRLPCGRDWYILKQGLFYCNKINRMSDAFPEMTQNFLRDSQKCLMQSLKDVYREDMVSCHDLEHQAVGAISQCFEDHAFCANLKGSFSEFMEIYETDDLFSTGAGKVWKEIAQLTLQCGGNEIENLASRVQNILTSLAGEAEEVLTNARDTIVDTLGDLFSW